MWNIFPTLLASVLLLPTPQSAASSSPLPLSPEDFASRRAALAREIQDGVFFLEGAKEPVLDLRHFQDDDFFYFTGVDTVDAALLLVVKRGKIAEETLFLPPKDTNWERWNGPRHAPGEDTAKALGIRQTAANATRAEAKKKALGETGQLFSETRKAFDNLQVLKSPAEISRVEKAIEITGHGFEAAIRSLRPRAFEYELMGALEGEFLKRGADGFAFPSIVGSGPNSCRLHYMASRRQMQEGELVVMDIGAKFEHYCADVTRTFPVSGKFSPRQAEVYGLVLEAQKRAIAAAKPGMTIFDVHQVAQNFFKEKNLEKHFWHSTSHFLGLKVHDTPTTSGITLAPGMIITVEPGLYFPEENLGVRIEDDILITTDGCRVLSQAIPREIAQVEAWIRRLRQ